MRHGCNALYKIMGFTSGDGNETGEREIGLTGG